MSKGKSLRLSVTVSVKWEDDDNPDLSFIGTYLPNYQEGAIDRQALGHMDRNEYRYFVSGNHSGDWRKEWEGVDKKDKAEAIRKYGSLANATRAYAKSDYERMEAYNRGEWRMRGCIVTVRLGALEAENSLWGIESDCGEDYEAEVVSDCTSQAIHELKDKVMKRLEVE